MKTCSTCKKILPECEYFKSSATKDGWHNQCKKCHTRSSKPAYDRNRATRVKQSERARKLRNFGLTQESWDKMNQSQEEKCAICGEKETQRDGQYGTLKKLSIDHCHSSGKIRGLLCQQCNFGLGCFRDNPEYLSAAVLYLNKTGKPI